MNVGWRSSILIVTLVFAILFSNIYFASLFNSTKVYILPSAVTAMLEPKVLPIDALKIVGSNLSRKLGADGYSDFGTYTPYGFYKLSEIENYTEKYGGALKRTVVLLKDDITVQNVTLHKYDVASLQLILFFQHPNGTMYIVDNYNGLIMDTCLQKEIQSDCFNPDKFYSDKAIGKLTYFLDIVIYYSQSAQNNTTNTNHAKGGYYLIDAKSGEILYSYIA